MDHQDNPQADIADKKKALLAELQAREARLIQVYKEFPVPAYTWKKVGDDFEFVSCNNAALKITKGKAKDVIGVKLSKFYSDLPIMPKCLHKCFNEQNSFQHQVDSYLYRTTGETHHTQNTFIYFPPERVVILQENITDKIEAENALKESEKQYRLLADNASDSIWTMDMEQRFTFLSPAIFKLRGYTPEEAMKIPLEKTLTPKSYKMATQAFMEEIAKEANPDVAKDRSRTLVLEQIKKDGSTIWTEVTTSFLRDENDFPIGIIGVTRDISERKRAEEKHRESEANLSALIESTDDIIALYDKDIRLLAFNKACKQIYKDLFDVDIELGMKTLELFPESTHEYWNAINSRALSGETFSDEMTLDDPKRGKRVFESTYYPIFKGNTVTGFATFNRDITSKKKEEEKRKKLEDRLNHAKRMETVGTLAGGIAHDVNNILQIITLNTLLLQDELTQDHDGQQSIASIIRASKKAASLIEELLAFSRTGKLVSKPFDLKNVIEEVIEILRQNLPKNIKMEVNIHPEVGSVYGGADQIQRVLINLTNNSISAMSENGGLLKIQAEPVIISDETQLEMKHLRPGPYLQIVVSDTGHGISEEIKQTIFEPFFTTKEVGQGTGLGLSVVYGIVTAHGGDIVVQSNVNEGSTFTVYLPSTTEREIVSEEINEKTFQGNGSILFVDDEPEQVHLGVLILEKAGFLVKGLSSGNRALEELHKNPDGFDVLIADQNMPGITGVDLLRQAHKLSPHLKTIIVTGRADDTIVQKLKDVGAQEILRKPYNPYDLSKIIEELINE